MLRASDAVNPIPLIPDSTLEFLDSNKSTSIEIEVDRASLGTFSFKRHSIREHLITLYSKKCRVITKKKYPYIYPYVQEALKGVEKFETLIEVAYTKWIHQIMINGFGLSSLEPIDRKEILANAHKTFFCYDVLEDEMTGELRCFDYRHALDSQLKKTKNKKSNKKQTSSEQLEEKYFCEDEQQLDELINILDPTTAHLASVSSISECLVHNIYILFNVLGKEATKEYIDVIYSGALLNIYRWAPNVYDSKYVRIITPRVKRGSYLQNGDVVCNLIDWDDEYYNNKWKMPRPVIRNPYNIARPLIHHGSDTRTYSLVVYLASSGQIIRACDERNDEEDVIYCYLTLPDDCPCKRFKRKDLTPLGEVFLTHTWMYGLWRRNGHQLSTFWNEIFYPIDEQSKPDRHELYQRRAIRTNYILDKYFQTGVISILRLFYPRCTVIPIFLAPNHRLLDLNLDMFYLYVKEGMILLKAVEISQDLKIKGKALNITAPSSGMFVPVSTQLLLDLTYAKNKGVFLKRNVIIGFFLTFTTLEYEISCLMNKEATQMLEGFASIAPALTGPLSLHLLFREFSTIQRSFDSWTLHFSIIYKPLCNVMPLLRIGETQFIPLGYQLPRENHPEDLDPDTYVFAIEHYIPLVMANQRVTAGDFLLISIIPSNQKDHQKTPFVFKCKHEYAIVLQDDFTQGAGMYLASVQPDSIGDVQNVEREIDLLNIVTTADY